MELYDFLYKMDEMYKCKENIFFYSDKIDNIREYLRLKEKESKEGVESDSKEYKKIQRHYERSLPHKKKEKEEYACFLREMQIEDSDNNVINIYKSMIKLCKKSIKQLNYECDVILYEHFFRDDLKNIINSTDISKDKIEKYLKLYDLIFQDARNSDEYANQFRNKVNRLCEKYVYLICKEMIQKYQKHKLTAYDLIAMLDKVNFSEINNVSASKLQMQAEEEIIQFFSNLISQRYANHINIMTKHLIKTGNIQDLGKYSLKVIRFRGWRKKSSIL